MESKQRRRLLEWGKNFLIVLLLFSAAALVRQSTLYEGVGIFSSERERNAEPLPPVSVALDGSKLSVKPVRLAVQNEQGRYGVQYDTERTDRLFEDKLGSLLREALGGAKQMNTVTQTDWQAVLQGEGKWIYYDFLTNLPLSSLPLWLGSEAGNAVLLGEARAFLLAESAEIYTLYCYDDLAEQYYSCTLAEGSGERFRVAIGDLPPNGVFFAFEDPLRFGMLDAGVMIVPLQQRMPVYEVKNPIAQLDKLTQDELLRALSFNPSASYPYETADGISVREGAGILRISNEGSISFQNQGGDARYPVPQEDRGALIEFLQKLLLNVMADRCGAARPYLYAVEEEEDGSLLLSFGYLLNGATVKIHDGPAAQFRVQNGQVQDFSIHIRQYTALEEQSFVLLEEQGVAIVQALGDEGANLQLAYLDTGEEGQLFANWINDLE